METYMRYPNLRDKNQLQTHLEKEYDPGEEDTDRGGGRERQRQERQRPYCQRGCRKAGEEGIYSLAGIVAGVSRN